MSPQRLLYQFNSILLYHWVEKFNKKISPTRAWQVCWAGVNNHADDSRSTQVFTN